MKIFSLVVFVLFCSLTAYPAEYDLGIHGILTLTPPEGWTAKGVPAIQSNGTSIGYAFAIKPDGDANAKCLLTIAYAGKGKPDPARIQQDVRQANEQFVEGSVEKRMNIQDFALKQGYGSYCTLTDASLVGKKPKQGEYKVMASGIVQLSDVVVGVVSIFADDAGSPEFRSMLQAINSLKLELKNSK